MKWLWAKGDERASSQSGDNNTSGSQSAHGLPSPGAGPLSPSGGSGTRSTRGAAGLTPQDRRPPGSTSGRPPASGRLVQSYHGPGDRQMPNDKSSRHVGEGGFMQAFQNMTGRGPGSAAADAEMERKVSVAARNLGDGVQKIVMAAKMGGSQGGSGGGSGGEAVHPDEWKIRLLQLLGGSDTQVGSSEYDNGSTVSDLDVLLTNSPCDKFVLRCVENELPPNLIHCLRLLRVLELQHANSQQHALLHEDSHPKPISTVATAKVSKLLCLLCTDPSVGEQLRPHLFGLLALSGASYPSSGVHVASAASSVILAFSEFCLSASLVWFLHDRKMIVHMTDDIKELCGMTAVSSSSSVTLCLYGKAAEEAGLWVVALRTVVSLVTFSCRYQCLELLKDFDAAGGYHVLCYSIANSGGKHVQKLLELVTTLVCCKTESDASSTTGLSRAADDGSVTSGVGSVADAAGSQDQDLTDARLATNPNSFEIVEDLMVRSVPFLAAYVESHNGQRPDLSSEESLRELATFSVNTARELRSESASPKGSGADSSEFDLASELLVTTLQLYSDHAKNYGIIESKYNILAHYLLAFPTFSDVSVKVLILKTLEYVCTGLVGTDAIKPLSVASEIFFALCKSLLEEEESLICEALLVDTRMLCETLEKLLQFDEKVGQVMVDGGLLGDKLDEFLSLVLLQTERVRANTAEEGSERESSANGVGEKLKIFTPPASTTMDGAYSAVCRILKLVVCQHLSSGSSASGMHASSALADGLFSGKSGPSYATQSASASNVNMLLTTGVKDLGNEAAAAALSVFDSMLGSHPGTDALNTDMDCVMELLDYFSEMTGKAFGVAAFTVPLSPPKRKRGGSVGEALSTSNGPARLGGPKKTQLDLRTVEREAKVLDMLKSVLEANEITQDVFRTSGGFGCVVRIFLCLEGVVDSLIEEAGTFGDFANDAVLGKESVGFANAVTKALESAFNLLAAATNGSRNQKPGATEVSMSSLAMDMLSEDNAMSTPGSTSSSGAIPAATNRNYLRQRNFYIEFATAIHSTGILRSPRHSRLVVNLALYYVDPCLNLPSTDEDGESLRRTTGDTSKSSKLKDSLFLRNPDATRLVLGVATRLPSTRSGVALAKRALDEILRLCAPDVTGSTLSQIASCGLCRSLTNPQEFSSFLEDRSHHLYSRFVLLLRRIAAFSMTYMDFVALLRCIAGPILRAGTYNGASDNAAMSKSKRIRLPVISSSVRTTQQQKPGDGMKSESWLALENDFCTRLETLSIIAERGDRVSRCEMGGDSLNTIALYMQKIPAELRLYSMAEEGRTKFLEVESIDASALATAMATAGSGGAANASSSSSAEKIWSPLQSAGFTYSLWLRLPQGLSENAAGNLFVLDLSSPPGEKSTVAPSGGSPEGGSSSKEFLSLWYDLQNQRFCVLSSSSFRNEPTCFPVSPLVCGVWHHILLTYQPAKRPMLMRKAVLGMCVDGRPLEAEVRVDSVNLPPTARMHIGVPNPYLASSGIVRGSLPSWDLGPMLLLSTLLGFRDATAIFTAGPDFEGLFWGDRPQRLSLTATATAAFAMLAESGEQGSVAGALRRRGVPEVEAAGHVMRERGFGGGPVPGPESDSLTAVGLLCNVSPEHVVCGFRGSSSSSSMRDRSSSSNKRHYSRRLVNVARINSSNESVSTDAVVYGKGSVISPHCFADNVQWIGGPNVLVPLVNASRSAPSLALALRLIRESVHRHPPNLEMLQAGGGYRMVGLLLRQKRIMDASVLDQCFAFAVHGFVPGSTEEQRGQNGLPPTWAFSDRWVFADLDAMKYLLLNHQVWDLRGSGPELPLRLLSFLNGLVAAHSAHSAFNSRRLHLLGIIRWTLHLMLEAAELYSAGESAAIAAGRSDGVPGSVGRSDDPLSPTRSAVLAGAGITPGGGHPGAAALKNGWYIKPPSVASTAVGGDPDNALLHGCKTLLRRVLTYMLTPGDLEAIAGAAIYTVSITGTRPLDADLLQQKQEQESGIQEDEKLSPGPVARVYLLRLLEELVVDGVNEIVTASNESKGAHDVEGPSESSVQPHAGGGTSTNQSYLATTMRRRANQVGAAGGQPPGAPNPTEATLHPKHQQAQAFLSAFAGILTPVWFACILEGCREEASASAVLRLMILMLQSSPTFSAAFEEAGGFAPLVLSIPKFSTCPSITMSMLSQLLHAPILHLPTFGTLDAGQLCEVFDSESDATELIINESIQGGLHTPSDPSCGIFALLAECLGRNIQLASFNNEQGLKARRTNEAVLQLLGHRHTFSSSFQEFCRTPDFLEPLAQALCLVHDEKLQRMQQETGSRAMETTADSYRRVDANSAANNGHDGSRSGDQDFMAWPDGGVGNDETRRMKRRGSLSGTVATTETPTERFVGKAEEDTGGSGIGMVQLLHLVLSHAVLSGPLAAPLVSALFRSFPIHASPDQVEAFHLVLIEHCRSVVEDALQRGEPIALANCVGVSSVLLDRLMAGFFTSEPVLEAVKIILSTLSCLTSAGTYASRTLGNSDQSMLVGDTAHLARLTCLTALQRSRPMGPYDEGDDDLKLAVLEAIGTNLEQLLLIPASANAQGSKRQGGGLHTPMPGSRYYPLWQSASLARCCPPSVACTYPDLPAVEEPDRAFVVALMAEIHILLLDKRRDIREQAVVIVVGLLQQRRGFMSELLITDIPRGESRVETVDLMNRGGFGALLVAHEAATIAENISTVPRSRSRRDSGSGGMSVGKLKYESFFAWLEKNQAQVAAVFHGIHIQASRLLPGVDIGAATPEEAIENEQKVMLLKLTSQDSSDRTILGGLERAELAQRSHDKTAESHALWKRQGFDDLSSGAMQWKFLLRQLKGSCSIWEGGVVSEEESPFSASRLFFSLKRKKILFSEDEKTKQSSDAVDKSKVAAIEVVTRWKLDLTEGYERQRRRLLPNYEFHGLYNLDETADHGDDADGVKSAVLHADEEDVGDETETVTSSAVSSGVTEPLTGSLDKRSQRRQGLMGDSMEATAALLKEMNLGPKHTRSGSMRRLHDEDDDDAEAFDVDDEEDDMETPTSPLDADNVSQTEVGQNIAVNENQDSRRNVVSDGNSKEAEESLAGTDAVTASELEGKTDEDEPRPDNVLASSYDLITGLLQAGDWPEKSYNVSRCTGLEVRKALLLWCRRAIYIVDGFEQTDGEGLEGKINRLEKESSTFYINLRPKGFTESQSEGQTTLQAGSGIKEETEAERNKSKEKSSQDASEEVTYQHRSQRIAFNDLYSVYRRRYQLQQIALEFYDVNRNGILIAFSNNAEREEVLSKVLSSPLPNSIFSSSFLGASTSNNYKKFMNSLRAKITSQWVNGRITNFDFLMHLNSFAGRSYNDLTQYPVFPWIIADYESEEIDLNDPNTYRDLSKPMGAQGESRALQFRERYEALEANYFNEDEPPPFHYGTHYSCAAYVLYYLMRLEPFSRLALSLQGGRFDVADRLFHNIGGSWRSASTENLQDVRELIPEFFYLPEFMVNSNMFDFGTTQVGKTVHHVTLPPWAKGDPERFIRINRQALESPYVSKNLHSWIDLVFGYKQRGREAVAALNTFVHVTYEGQVDLDAITDPVQRESTIAQIHNFGQTPSRLERKPFPQRNVVSAAKERSIDFSALSSLGPLTPPFCVVGAPHRVYLRVSIWDTCKVGMAGQTDSSVGDMCLVKGALVGVGRTCALILPSKKYYRFGGPNNGLSVHVAVASARYREVNRVLSIHDGMHRAPISVAKPSLNGQWLVTGCMDSTVRVWKYDNNNMELRATLCGHEGGQVTCIDVSTTFGSVVTGGADGNVLLWDLRTLTFLRQLRHASRKNKENTQGSTSGSAAVSVSINHKNGNVLTLVGTTLSLFDINGNLLATPGPDDEFGESKRPSCAVATDCPEWMEKGVVAITGHVNGDVRLWSLDCDEKVLLMRFLLPEKVHSCPITALRVSGERQDTLLIGDKSGKMSVCKTLQLDNLSQQELASVLKELRTGDVKTTDKSGLMGDAKSILTGNFTG